VELSVGSAAIDIGWEFAAVLTALLGAAALAARLAGLRAARDLLGAGLRAVVQLAAESALIAWVLTAALIALVVAVAAWTSARRLGTRRLHWTAAAIGAGVGPVLELILAARTVPAEPVAVVPVAGSLVGGAMTATALKAPLPRCPARAARGVSKRSCRWG
jgi:putative ABC transport system permease protein